MGAVLAWIEENWFSLAQSAGIIGGICFAAVGLHRDARARRISALLSQAEQHRELWAEAHRRPELGRVVQPVVDLVAAPLSVAEREFVNVAMVHFHTSWLLSRGGSLLTPDVLTSDARWFFDLPVPRAVWEETKHLRDARFVRFVEGALRRGEKPRT